MTFSRMSCRAPMRRIVQGSVVPTFDLNNFKKELAGFDFRSPRPLDELLSWSIAQLEHGIVHMTHPRYFGLFNPAPTFPPNAQIALSGLSIRSLRPGRRRPPRLKSRRTSSGRSRCARGCPRMPSAIALRAAQRRTARRCMCALTRAKPRLRNRGRASLRRARRPFTSLRTAISRGSRLPIRAGIGRAAARLVPTDGHGPTGYERARSPCCARTARAAECR